MVFFDYSLLRDILILERYSFFGIDFENAFLILRQRAEYNRHHSLVASKYNAYDREKHRYILNNLFHQPFKLPFLS